MLVCTAHSHLGRLRSIQGDCSPREADPPAGNNRILPEPGKRVTSGTGEEVGRRKALRGGLMSHGKTRVGLLSGGESGLSVRLWMTKRK